MKPVGIAAFVFCLALLARAPALADGFSVNPTRLELKPSQGSTALIVANYNDAPVFMQVRVYRWEHKDGADVLSDVQGSEAPLVTPPLFRLSAHGGSQVVRIGFQRASAASAAPAASAASVASAAPAEERQWRVIVEEVPKTSPAANESPAGTPPADPAPAPAPAPAAPAPDGTAPAAPASNSEPGAPSISIAIHLRISLPLFELPVSMRQELEWSLARADGGHLTLTAENRGTITERLDEISLSWQDKGSVRKPGPLYVFPGERHSFDVQPDTVLPAGSIHLSLQGTPRTLTRELVLSAQ